MSLMPDFSIHLLAPNDHALMDALLTMFGEAFDDVPTYSGKRPSEGYMQQLLGSDAFFALVALKSWPPQSAAGGAGVPPSPGLNAGSR